MCAVPVQMGGLHDVSQTWLFEYGRECLSPPRKSAYTSLLRVSSVLQVFLLLLSGCCRRGCVPELSYRTAEEMPSAHPCTQVPLLITVFPALDKVKLGTQTSMTNHSPHLYCWEWRAPHCTYTSHLQPPEWNWTFVATSEGLNSLGKRFNAGSPILCNAKLPASFSAYFWPRPTSISAAMPGHQKSASTHQGLLPVRRLGLDSGPSSHATFQHHPNTLYNLRALIVLLPVPKARNTSSTFIPCRQQFHGPQQFLCYNRDFETEETQKLQPGITGTVQ